MDFARNRALRSAAGDVVAFVDDDVVVDPDWLARIAAVWREEPETGAVTGQILPLELTTDAQVAFERHGGFRGGNERVRYCGPSRDGDPVYPYGPGMFGAGANMAVHRATALALGAFDEALDTGPPLPGGGDIDMMHRVVRHGHPLVYEPRAVVFHRHRRGADELLRQYRSWGESLMAFVVKTYRNDPAGRPKLRLLVRWFFSTQCRAFIRGGAERAAARSEIVGGIVGLCGTYGRSQRRSARIRRTSGPPVVAVVAPTVDASDPVVTGWCRRVVDAVSRAGGEPVVVGWSPGTARPARHVDVPTGTTVRVLPDGPPQRRRRWWSFDAPTRAMARVLRDEGCGVVICAGDVDDAGRIGAAAAVRRLAVFSLDGDLGRGLARWPRRASVAAVRVDARHLAVVEAVADELHDAVVAP